jgi:prepilin-type processing-associated H-X9-DG protein
VIAALAALLLPVFAAARERAQHTACLSNMRQIAQAQLMYLHDFDDRFPHWYFPGPRRPEPYGDFVFWTEFLQPYLRNEAVLRCPHAEWIWEVPAEKKLAEYVLATWGRGGKGTRQIPYWNWPGPSHTLAAVRRPTETITVIDGFTTAGWTSVDLRRHRGGCNASFVDGHARWMPQGEFWAAEQEGSAWHMRYASADR